MEKPNINRLKNLHTDNSFVDQPPGTTRFVLNGVKETNEGDRNFIANEEANEACFSLPVGFIPLGSVYIGNDRTAILSVSSDDTISEIGIVDGDCNYVTHVNDALADVDKKLNFKISNQIDVIYRLRRGCEDTIYFVDGDNNKPRYYNFNSPSEFKTGGSWDANKFELIRSYRDIPIFDEITVLNSGGQIQPGSVNVGIQYLDNDLNPTEWISVSDMIYIFNDSLEKQFKDINGSINSDTDYINFPITNKAIKVVLDNLDESFAFYRLAFIESNNGTGLINNVNFTETIPITKNFFIYTGTNFISQGTQEEIQVFTQIIDSVGSIEQIENRLILGNVKGPQVNFCKLQKYASKIKADCITQKVILNDLIDPSNSKNPTHRMHNVGYMPGEIYSFGIVYVFADGSISPVFHIPGKNPTLAAGTTFNTGVNIFPMSLDNQGNSTYIDNNSCNDYWGVDSEGETLLSKSIRHHRFPLRTDINKPLVVEESTVEGSVQYYNLALRIQGTIVTPVDFDVDPLYNFDVRVSYKVDGQDYSFSINIDASTYADGTGSYVIDMYQYSQYHGSNVFTDITVSITDTSDNFQSEIAVVLDTPVSTAEDNSYFVGESTYTVSSEIYDSSTTSKIFSSEILGIQFSGVEIPSLDDVNGKQVVGYYIVRNERTEFDKTILDSGVLVPSLVNSKYVSHGLLQPEFSGTSKTDPTVYGLIHPEHRFNNNKYTEYDKLIQQGNFDIIDTKYGKVNYDDVYDGTSFDGSVQKEGNDDGKAEDGSPTSKGLDGWSFNVISRDSITSFAQKKTFELENIDIKERFYLDALESRTIDDNAKEVFNIAADNKVGIIELEDGGSITPSGNNLPYVVMYKENLDVYSNFRVLPYYKQNINPILFANPSSDTATIFSGDSYVSPMRYVNTIFWDNRIAKRKGKTSALKIILGVALAVLGTVFAVFTAGASTVLIGAGISLIGAGALFASSGIKQSSFNKAYNEEYNKGLRDTVLDDWVDRFYNYRNDIPFGYQGNGSTGSSGPSDDTLQWIGDCITDLWFETTVNTNLRNGHIVDNPTFLNSPGDIETGNDTAIGTWEFFGLNYTDSNAQRYPISALERHLVKKLLAFDPDRDDNRYYIGVPLGEYYNLNPDYLRTNKSKIFYHLGLEYDCCSDCNENFPHRVHYSEQSFQEELTDNYRVFLPNNYKDIEGEKGKITNLYRIQTNLYIHTQEALWHLPQSYQERVTGDIVSFLGTGSYFEIPPRLISDADESSAGTEHKWGCHKSKNGILFPSMREKKWYLFNGNELKPISDYGNSNWFKEHMSSLVAQQYYASNKRPYPYLNNPSNPIGEGFISTYDTKKERLIVTKKDFSLKPEIIANPDYELCFKDGQVILFDGYQDTIDTYNTNGFEFLGIEDCKMKFSKTEYEIVEETRTVSATIPNNADIIIYYDTSGSFDITARNQIKSAVDNWLLTFAAANPDWTGSLIHYESAPYFGEKWMGCVNDILSTYYPATDPGTLDLVVITFTNESNPNYHKDSFNNVIDAPYPDFNFDYITFKTLYGAVKSFRGIAYPIVFTTGVQADDTREYLKHVLAAMKGTSYTSIETDAIPINNGFTPTDWITLKDALEGTNPYDDDGLENYGWKGIWNKYWTGTGDIISAEEFEADINDALLGTTTTEEIIVEVLVPVTTIEYVEGEVVVGGIIQNNNSWTMSFDLKDKEWISWHSYLPNFYFYLSEKFFNWTYGNNNFFKHNKLGQYQTFNGVYYPHIIEYVSLSSPLITRIWDWLRFQTEAKEYNVTYEDYVDKRFITHNKLMVYNTRQHSGLLELITKNTLENTNYLGNQIVNQNNNQIIIDREERDWHVNDFRDIRIDYDLPMFDKRLSSLQSEYFIDKIINTVTIDENKDWTQLESFRDKFLVIRFIFDNFDNIRLITNYSIEPEDESKH